MAQQYVLFFYFLLLGVAIAFIYNIFQAVVFIFKKNIVIQIIFDFIFMASAGLAFMFCCNKFNSGQIRWFLVLATIFGIYLHFKTLGKIFAKVGILLYNHLVKLNGKFKNSKVGKVLFKWKFMAKKT